jgi:hypothetical protein
LTQLGQVASNLKLNIQVVFIRMLTIFSLYFPMQEIVQIRILLQINNITKRLFQDCPRFVPEILRGTKNIRGAGGTGDKI